MTDREHSEELVMKALELLTDHFDTVQIFASSHEPEVEGGTIAFDQGTGNWYARYGQVRTWIIKHDQSSRNEVSNA